MNVSIDVEGGLATVGRKSEKIASLSPIGRAFRKVFTSSSASSVRRKAFPESKVSATPMSYVGARRFAAPTLRLKVVGLYCYSEVDASGGVTAISRINLIRPPPAVPYGLACSRFRMQFAIRYRGRQTASSTVEPKND